MSLLACATRKEEQYEKQATENSSQQESISDHTEHKGIIWVDGIIVQQTETKPECEFLIEVVLDNQKQQLVPLHIPEEHKIDGKKIRFYYSMSRRQSSCGNAIPIVIEKIEQK